METNNGNLSKQFTSLEEKLREMAILRDEERRKHKVLEGELEDLRQIKDSVEEENKKSKDGIQKGVENITKALGDAYYRRLGRISTLGVISGCSLEVYIRDYAASTHGGSRLLSDAANWWRQGIHRIFVMLVVFNFY